jgi:hypothetical protein
MMPIYFYDGTKSPDIYGHKTKIRALPIRPNAEFLARPGSKKGGGRHVNDNDYCAVVADRYKVEAVAVFADMSA